jgi:hypothetical protein
LYKAGFTEVKLLAIMWAIIESESGGYLKAWHNNVMRNEDGTIYLEDGKMIIQSTDLGFIQKNVVHNPPVKLEPTAEKIQPFIDSLFEANPDLARGDKSAEIAYQLYKSRGFQPWYAYSNGSYKRNISRGCLAVGNMLGLILGQRPVPLLQRRYN